MYRMRSAAYSVTASWNFRPTVWENVFRAIHSERNVAIGDGECWDSFLFLWSLLGGKVKYKHTYRLVWALWSYSGARGPEFSYTNTYYISTCIVCRTRFSIAVQANNFGIWRGLLATGRDGPRTMVGHLWPRSVRISYPLPILPVKSYLPHTHHHSLSSPKPDFFLSPAQTARASQSSQPRHPKSSEL